MELAIANGKRILTIMFFSISSSKNIAEAEQYWKLCIK